MLHVILKSGIFGACLAPIIYQQCQLFLYLIQGTCLFCFTSFLPLCRPGDLCVSLAQHQCSQNCQEIVAFHKIVFSPFYCIWAHVFVDDWHPSYNALGCVHLWVSLTILVLSPLTLALLEILELYPICLMQRVGNDA